MDKHTMRVQNEQLLDRVVTPEKAATWIKDGMTIGMSGFTKAGEAKAVPFALIERAKKENIKFNLFTGASLGSNIDTMFAEYGMVMKRMPFQADRTMRHKINEGEILFVDSHLSQIAEFTRANVLDKIDIAILEAVSITEDGLIIPTTSVGNSLSFANQAEEIIVEINLAQTDLLHGIHDVYDPGLQGVREPININHVDDRVGEMGIRVDLDKIKGIVFTDIPDDPSPITPPDIETNMIAQNLISFLRSEVKAGRLTNELAPLQAGIGTVANAVLHGLLQSEFENLTVFSEVLQDAVFDLIDAGKVKSASCCSITLTEEKMNEIYNQFDKYRHKLIMRPQEISNHPEVIRRLGTISINTALEFDIYGNVNSTHVTGTKMMNGIGGSGDFARNARLSIFVTKSIAKDGDISSVVPFVSHVDHTEHDVDVVVTEQGYVDLRGLAPRERAPLIIENCVHPQYREQLRDYYNQALEKGGHTPHDLERAFSWHQNLIDNKTMRELTHAY